MMGSKARSFASLSHVSLDGLVPGDHSYLHLQRSLDLSFVRDLVPDTYAAGGRPSIPLSSSSCNWCCFSRASIRSGSWCGWPPIGSASAGTWAMTSKGLPDHSSLTRIRRRHGPTTFRRYFEVIVEQCRRARLIWRRELYFDAIQVDTNASLDSSAPRFSVEAHLSDLFAAEAANEPRLPEGSRPVELPVAIPKAVQSELRLLNSQRQDWLARGGHPDRTFIRAGYRRRAEFEASTTDPDATLMARKGRGLHFGSHDHYAVDGGKTRIILGVLVTPADVMENQPLLDLLRRLRVRWQLHPVQVTGDTTYGTVENIVTIEDHGIRAYVPLL